MGCTGSAKQRYIPLHTCLRQTCAGEAILDFYNSKIAVLGLKYGSLVFVLKKNTLLFVPHTQSLQRLNKSAHETTFGPKSVLVSGLQLWSLITLTCSVDSIGSSFKTRCFIFKLARDLKFLGKAGSICITKLVNTLIS